MDEQDPALPYGIIVEYDGVIQELHYEATIYEAISYAITVKHSSYPEHECSILDYIADPETYPTTLLHTFNALDLDTLQEHYPELLI